MVVHAGPGEEPWDAANYLGGIADVLEGAKKLIAQPGLLDWLGGSRQDIVDTFP